jgi:hypothetical protein
MEDDKKMVHTVTQGSVTNGKSDAMPISTGKRILYHLWDQDQHLKSPEERKLVRKLDFGILICATLGWVNFSHANGPKTCRADSPLVDEIH